MGDWFGVAIVFGVAVIAFVLKFVIIKCYLNRCRRGRSNQLAWTDVEEGPSLEAFFIGDVHAVRCVGRNKGPPPKFEKALKCSSPVHFEVSEEEPPPSYEEYMKGQPALFTIASSSAATQVGRMTSAPESYSTPKPQVKAIQSAARNSTPVPTFSSAIVTRCTIEAETSAPTAARENES